MQRSSRTRGKHVRLHACAVSALNVYLASEDEFGAVTKNQRSLLCFFLIARSSVTVSIIFFTNSKRLSFLHYSDTRQVFMRYRRCSSSCLKKETK